MNAPALARCLIAAAAAAPLSAQAAPAPNDASKQVHAAWLREVLDLDVPGAVESYQKIAQDHRPAHLERWIAVARLVELERAGIRIEPKPAFTDAPAAIRQQFAALTPIPVAEVLQRASGDPANLLQATEAGPMPALRPVTWQVQDWLRGQGLSLRDRLRTRERIDSLNRPRRGPDPYPWYAADILNVELEGRQEQAVHLRALFFPDWKPPATNGDPAALLPRVRANLDAWSKEPGLSSSRQNLLRRLRDAVELRAKTDPAAAVAFVARQPLYAERLLAEPPRR